MTVREELLKAIETMNEEELAAVMDYIRLLKEPEEVAPTEEERQAIARGKKEYSRGEYAKWHDIKRRSDA